MAWLSNLSNHLFLPHPVCSSGQACVSLSPARSCGCRFNNDTELIRGGEKSMSTRHLEQANTVNLVKITNVDTSLIQICLSALITVWGQQNVENLNVHFCCLLPVVYLLNDQKNKNADVIFWANGALNNSLSELSRSPLAILLFNHSVFNFFF